MERLRLVSRPMKIEKGRALSPSCQMRWTGSDTVLRGRRDKEYGMRFGLDRVGLNSIDPGGRGPVAQGAAGFFNVVFFFEEFDS